MQYHGSNVLRGGKTTYPDGKVLVGNWYEVRHDPEAFVGTRPEVKTTQQVADLSATGAAVPTFGVTLGSTRNAKAQYTDRLDYGNITNPYRAYPPNHWASVTALTHFGAAPHPEDGHEFGTKYKLVQNALTRDPQAMAAYRARWINDDDGANAGKRFTSSVAWADVHGPAGAAHTVSGARFLRGVPKSVEIVRQRAVERWGVAGVRELALCLPADLTLVSLRKVFADHGLPVSVDQALDTFKALNPGDHGGGGRVEGGGEALTRLLLGHGLNEARLAAVRRAWAVLEDVSAEPGKAAEAGVPDTRTLALALVVQPSHPDVKPPLRRSPAVVRADVLAAFGASDAVPAAGAGAAPLSYEAFEGYHTFLSAAVDADELFDSLLDGMWRFGEREALASEQVAAATGRLNLNCTASLQASSIASGKLGRSGSAGAAGAFPHVCVLVTRSDGSKTIAKLPRDRFLLPAGVATVEQLPKEALIERLARQGLVDVVDVSTDFSD